MIRDILTIAWKEWLEFLQPEASRRLRPFRGLLFILIGGAFIGWEMDPDFGSSWLTVFLVSFLSVMFVTGVIPDSVAGERERHTLETLLATRLPDHAILLGKVTAAVSYGCAMGLAILPAGIVTANLLHGVEGEPWVRWDVMAVTLISSLLGGLIVAAVGVLLSLYAPTARQANQRLGFAIMGLFFLPAIALPILPGDMRNDLLARLESLPLGGVIAVAFAVLSVLAATLLLAALVRFRRARLTL